MGSILGCVGVIKKKIVSVICGEDLVTVLTCLYLLRLPQNLVLIVLQLLLFLVVKEGVDIHYGNAK